MTFSVLLSVYTISWGCGLSGLSGLVWHSMPFNVLLSDCTISRGFGLFGRVLDNKWFWNYSNYLKELWSVRSMWSCQPQHAIQCALECLHHKLVLWSVWSMWSVWYNNKSFWNFYHWSGSCGLPGLCGLVWNSMSFSVQWALSRKLSYWGVCGMLGISVMRS